jgi:hypothetical protein
MKSSFNSTAKIMDESNTQPMMMSVNHDEANSFGYNSFGNIDHTSPHGANKLENSFKNVDAPTQ